MSFDPSQVPSKSEVMSWNPLRLAEYMKKLKLTGCDKVIMKCSMNGPRFLNMSDNDLQKFPKLHAPLITKICCEINKKEEKRGIFHKKPAPQKYQEQDFEPDNQGWDSEEFESDDDYESPDVDDDEADGGDYESPNEGESDRRGSESDIDNEYEPPPSDPPEGVPPQICSAKPMGDGDYIDNNRNRGVQQKALHSQPPMPPERPGSGLTPPAVIRQAGRALPRREQSPQRPIRLPNKPPPVHRDKKPGCSDRGPPSLPGGPDREDHFPGRKPGMPDRSATPPRRPPMMERQAELPPLPKPPIPGPGVSRSSSSLGRPPIVNRPGAQDHRNNPQEEAQVSKPGGGAAFNSNTFPLPSRGMSPRPMPSPSPFLSESVPPGGSLPSRLHAAMNAPWPGQRGQPDRFPLPQPAPQQPLPMHLVSDPDDEQDLDPRWYVGHVTRGQAEGLLRQINLDGTYLVRDSSKRSSTQPYTLMVLYQGKVYNIQIRYNSEKDIFLLGTSLKNRENFTRVRDIIEHHVQVPLLLIDAKEHGSAPQKQCALLHPVQY